MPAKSIHSNRFPGESSAYRAARESLLDAEIELRRQTESVAALRRQLPLGGRIEEDYVFQESRPIGDDETVSDVRLSQLFEPDKETLVVYSFMYGPEMAAACPSCTSILDGLDGVVQHLTQRVNLAVVAKSPIQRIRFHARERGWRRLRLLSSAGNTYNRDYHGETEEGHQIPALNVFVLREGRVHHVYNTELLYAPADEGQDPRHVDSIWPLWNLFDLTPSGRPADWDVALRYH
jgi:predicted dithiol-disulfide oxidoreductase (DUF899 family)